MLWFFCQTASLWTNFGFDIAKKYLLNGQIIEDKWISKDWIQKHFKKDLDAQYSNKFLG